MTTTPWTNAPMEHHYHARPSALAFMAQALLPRPRARLLAPWPNLHLHWHTLDASTTLQDAAQHLCATGAHPVAAVLLPQILAFRLPMAWLTHRACPIPLWRALQIRNHLQLLHPITPDLDLDAQCSCVAVRQLDKGLEMDLCTRLLQRARPVWQGTTTFYYRGVRAAAAQPGQPAPPAPDVQAAPLVQRWIAPRAGGWQFGALTGDYNGLHWSDAYARALGFAGACFHPQRLVAQALAALPQGLPGDCPQTLELWIKGTVRYGAALQLRATSDARGTAWALHQGTDTRAAIVGRWYTTPL